MSVELIQQLEQSKIKLQKIRENRILTDKRLNKIQKDCDEIKKDLYEMREYINECYIKQYNLN